MVAKYKIWAVKFACDRDLTGYSLQPLDFDMSDAQQEHALAVEQLAPRLAALRIELCPGYMSESCFWKIYFVLLHPRLDKQDAELLSTPQVLLHHYCHLLPSFFSCLIFVCHILKLKKRKSDRAGSQLIWIHDNFSYHWNWMDFLILLDAQLAVCPLARGEIEILFADCILCFYFGFNVLCTSQSADKNHSVKKSPI